MENYYRIYVPPGIPLKREKDKPLRVNVLFKHIQELISGDIVVITETGDSWFNYHKLCLLGNCGYEFQIQYGSIGCSVGAMLGYAQAATDKRVIACIGDGSDFSAAIMVILFRARQITIWTDVAGVYSADPRKVSEAMILKTISYREASKISYFGANVLHPRTISPIIRYGIPVIIRNISIPLLLEQWYAILLILKMKI